MKLWRCGHEKTKANTTGRGRTHTGQCRTCARAAWRRYQKSPRGRARNRRAGAKYWKSPKGKATRRRYNVGGAVGARRLNRDGTRFTISDFNELLREAGRKCFVCRRRFTKRRPAVVDHDHKRGWVRHLTCNADNLVEGILKRIGIRTYDQLQMWAVRMGALRMMPGLAMGEGWKPRRRAA